MYKRQLLAAAQCAPAEDLPAYVQQAAYSIDCFLKDYGDDGCCSEGVQYYRHAALTMFNALDLLCKMAPGVFDDVWAEPKTVSYTHLDVYKRQAQGL